jgi:hypothetical protein
MQTRGKPAAIECSEGFALEKRVTRRDPSLGLGVGVLTGAATR